MAAVYQVDQRSDDWFAARCGKLTASKLADAIAKTLKGWGASRANYRADLVAQRLTGVCFEGYKSAAMQHGIDNEEDGCTAYELTTGHSVEHVGFIDHPTIEWSGASPDGLIGDDGMLEIKCPNTATHIDWLLGKTKIPAKYMTQMQWQMACAGRQWVDFVSYDPRLPGELMLWIQRVDRDDERIAELEEMAQEFLAEVAADVEALKALT